MGFFQVIPDFPQIAGFPLALVKIRTLSLNRATAAFFRSESNWSLLAND